MGLQEKSPQKSNNAVSSSQGKLIAIVGPTAAGKTDVALRLAEQYPLEIVCVDSRTIYQAMDIGTAKPSIAEQKIVPHHGLNLIPPGERYSVAEYVEYAQSKMSEIWARGNAVALVGGSGMYIDALLFGYKFRSQKEFQQEFTAMGHDEILALVRKRYPAEVIHIDVNNTRRLVQLLERGPTDSADREVLKYRVKIIGIDPGNENLQMRIGNRAQRMLKQGFVQECKKLSERYGADCQTLQTTGYSAVMSYLNGDIEDEAMLQQIISDTKKLAKKQRTWFRRNPHIVWVDREDEAVSVATSYLGT